MRMRNRWGPTNLLSERRKRAMAAPSCTELVWDEFFEGAWLAHERDADEHGSSVL